MYEYTSVIPFSPPTIIGGNIGQANNAVPKNWTAHYPRDSANSQMIIS